MTTIEAIEIISKNSEGSGISLDVIANYRQAAMTLCVEIAKYEQALKQS